MLRSIVVAAAVVGSAFAAPGDMCNREPYKQMQEYKGFEPAREHCRTHFPQSVVTKTMPAKCLTTTKTIIEHTDHITVTRTEPCHTTPSHYSTESKNPVPTGYKKPQHYARAEPAGYGATPAGYKEPAGYKTPAGYSPAKETPHHYEPSHEHHESHHDEPPHYKLPEIHGMRHHQWREYHEELLKCGYDCVQRACQCITKPKTSYVSYIEGMIPTFFATAILTLSAVHTEAKVHTNAHHSQGSDHNCAQDSVSSHRRQTSRANLILTRMQSRSLRPNTWWLQAARRLPRPSRLRQLNRHLAHGKIN